MNFEENPSAHVQNSSTQISTSDFSRWKCPTKVGNVSCFLLCWGLSIGVIRLIEEFGDFCFYEAIIDRHNPMT